MRNSGKNGGGTAEREHQQGAGTRRRDVTSRINLSKDANPVMIPGNILKDQLGGGRTIGCTSGGAPKLLYRGLPLPHPIF